MEKEEIIVQANKLLGCYVEGGDPIFHAEDVLNINHRPHPYTIGPKHLEHNDSIYLGEPQIRRMDDLYGPMCQWRGTNGKHGPLCTLRWNEHKSDRVMFLKLCRNATKDEATEMLQTLAEDLLKPEGIDGITLIETPERYRIQ